MIGHDNDRRFRICTLVTNWRQYDAMKASFLAMGFDDANSRFSTFDNSQGNRFEPYSLINELLGDTEEPYIVLCHQDIVLDRGHGYDRLCRIIDGMNERDPSWAVLGNAGCTDDYDFIVNVCDPTGWQDEDRVHSGAEVAPQRVHSLDENFLLLKRTAPLRVSSALSGFHLYGTDICLNARLAGLTCYVVDFRLTHLSPGNFGEDFQNARSRFIQRWSSEFHFLYIIRGAQIFLSKWRILRSLGPRARVRRLFQQNSLLRSVMTLEIRRGRPLHAPQKGNTACP